jgi:predicted transcriptional regulator
MLAKLKSSLREFYPYAKKRLGFDRPVRLFLRNDPHNAADVYGKTAYYDPQEEKVVLYVTNRHPKDILRSFAHELVHHKQNCDGRLSGLTAGEGYAQTEQGEQLEKEAYLGSMMFRNFEDTRRKQMTTEELKQKVENIVKEYLDEKKKMPDENKDGVPDFAQDGKGANDLGKGKAKPKKKKGGKVPSQLEPFVKGKKKDEDEKEEVDEGSCGKRDPKEDDEDKKYTGSQDAEHSAAMKAGGKLVQALGESKKVIKETPQPKPEQTNDDWYWGSLYGKLKEKWTK